MIIGLGTVQFGCSYGVSNTCGQTPIDEIKDILHVAKENGIEVIDTAPAYGESECSLGEAFSTGDSFRIVTKTPVYQSPTICDDDSRHLVSIFRNSLHSMKRDSVHGLMVHHAGNLLQDGGSRLWEALESLKRDGFVSKIGVSVYHRAQIDRIMESFPIDIIQLPVNVFDQRLIKSGHLAYLKNMGVEIHARSAFLQGLLLMDPVALPSYFLPYQKLLMQYHDTVAKLGLTPVQAALGFVANRPEIDSVICGVNNHQQLLELCDAMGSPLQMDFGAFACDDEALVNPALWKTAS